MEKSDLPLSTPKCLESASCNMMSDSIGIGRRENGRLVVVNAQHHPISAEFTNIQVFDVLVSTRARVRAALLSRMRERIIIPPTFTSGRFFMIGESDNALAVILEQRRARQEAEQISTDMLTDARDAINRLLAGEGTHDTRRQDFDVLARAVQNEVQPFTWHQLLDESPRKRQDALRTLIYSSEGFNKLQSPLSAPYYDEALEQCLSERGACVRIVHPLTGEPAHEQSYHAIERSGKHYVGVLGTERQRIEFSTPLPQVKRRVYTV